MSRHVKGVLFADYVKMIRSHKGLEWSTHLTPADLLYVAQTIDRDAWYPMETFERLGNAILTEIANCDLEAVRMWGRLSADQLVHANPMLLCDGDPMETLMRFRVLRATYFDFDALSVSTLVADHAHIVIRYHMGPIAEEAASYQAMGFFERLVELAGARDMTARFRERSWTGDKQTLLELHWAL